MRSEIIRIINSSDTSGTLTVRVGSTFYKNGGSIIQVKQFVQHNDFKFVKKVPDYDFSLIELVEPLNFTDQIQPIALPASDKLIVDGTLCLISGWGKRFKSQLKLNCINQCMVFE